MRNREQIYGQEAAGLLRNITVYHCIRHDQLLRLYPGKEDVIENLLRYLVKQQRIFYNTDRDCYGDAPNCREDKELTAALWVLLDFIEKVEYHSPDDTPAKLVFFADGEVYEVVYVGPGKEALLQHALAAEDDSGQRLAILNEQGRRKAQFLVNAVIHYINCPESPEAAATPKIDRQTVEQLVREILSNMQPEATPGTEGNPSGDLPPTTTSESIPFDAAAMLGEDGFHSLLSSLAAIQDS